MNGADARLGRCALALAAVALANVAWFSGCSLPRLGTMAKQCSSEVDCDDGEPCTRDVCSADGVCEHTPDDEVVLDQVEGDCRRAVCVAGARTDVPDDADVGDDGDECTVGSCEDGELVHAAVDDGHPCEIGLGAGACEAGVCEVDCTAENGDVVCDDLNPCTVDGCNLALGRCERVALDAVAPQDGQIEGDCRLVVCSQGKETVIDDDRDAPDDGNPCTVESCVDGIPESAFAAANMPCADPEGIDVQAKVCNGEGSCVQCNVASQCTHLDEDDCRLRACLPDGTCEQQYVEAGTPLAAPKQTPGDCLELVCDGYGLVKLVGADDPQDDGNDCTSESCSDGTQLTSNLPAGTACGSGALMCDGGGVCGGCTSDSQCAPDTFCADRFCNLATGTCATVFTNVGAVLPHELQAAGDCQELRCDGSGQVASVATDDPPSDDGLECTAAICVEGAAEHPLLPLGTPCSGGFVCSGLAPECPTQCLDDSLCQAGHFCQAGACVPKRVQGAACGDDGECASAICSDAVCCDAPCAEKCEACGSDGCVQLDGVDPDDECPGADVCDGNNQCRCENGTLDPGESDVDCGGGACPPCLAGKQCAAGTDCVSGVCEGGVCAGAACGDGVVNGGEACDYADPATPCCATNCTGPAAAGVVCGADSVPGDCFAAPRCDGKTSGITSCKATYEPNGTLCTSDGSFCNGVERCQTGICVGDGNPCPGPDGDANCRESCDEVTDTCAADDPNGSPCDNGAMTCQAGICQ